MSKRLLKAIKPVRPEGVTVKVFHSDGKFVVTVPGRPKATYRTSDEPDALSTAHRYAETMRVRGPAPTLTKAEQARIIEAAKARGPMALAMVTLALDLGFRVSDLAGLEWRDVTLHDGTIADAVQIRPEVGKRGKAAQLGMPSHLRDALAAWQSETRYAGAFNPVFPITKGPNVGHHQSPNTVTYWFKYLFESLGMPRHSAHSLRATFAGNLDAVGESPFVIKAAMRHAKLETTDLYVRATAIQAVPAIEAIAASRGQS